MHLLLMIAITGGPQMPHVQHEHVDCIEINHVYDSKCCLVFTQVILWKVDESDGRLHNWGWKIPKHQFEMPYPWLDEWRVFHIAPKGVITIDSPCLRKRSTQEDMERKDTREFWAGQAPNLFLMEVEVLE